MISSRLSSKLKGMSLRIDPAARTSTVFLGDDLNIYLISTMILLSLKYYSKEIKIQQTQILVGNVFFRKYQLDNYLAEALTSSPHLCEKSTESIVFLEATGLIYVLGEEDRSVVISERGEKILKSFQKDHPSLYRRLRIIFTSLKKEGLAFV